MSYICDKKYIGFDSLEAETDNVISLLEIIINGYFSFPKERIAKNKLLLAHEYERYLNLTFLGLDMLHDYKKTLAIVRENFEGESE